MNYWFTIMGIFKMIGEVIIVENTIVDVEDP